MFLYATTGGPPISSRIKHRTIALKQTDFDLIPLLEGGLPNTPLFIYYFAVQKYTCFPNSLKMSLKLLYLVGDSEQI